MSHMNVALKIGKYLVDQNYNVTFFMNINSEYIPQAINSGINILHIEGLHAEDHNLMI